MNNNGAFSRAKSMMSAIAAVLAAGFNTAEQRAKLVALGQYESHGKGGKHPHRSVGTAAHKRAALKARNVARNRRAHRN